MELKLATIRIEPVLDRQSGFYFVEIYHPADAQRPFVTTEPRYASAAAAENDTIAILAAGANNPVAPAITPAD
jgi:hypothetical protein